MATDNRKRQEQISVRFSPEELQRFLTAECTLQECTRRDTILNAVEFAARHKVQYMDEKTL